MAKKALNEKTNLNTRVFKCDCLREKSSFFKADLLVV